MPFHGGARLDDAGVGFLRRFGVDPGKRHRGSSGSEYGIRNDTPPPCNDTTGGTDRLLRQLPSGCVA